MKVRNIISLLRESLNNLNLDMRFSNQFLHNTIITNTALIVRRESESRKIYTNIESFQSIRCLNLESVDMLTCADIIVPCQNLMKSTVKIPKVYQSNTGPILQVFSLGRITQFHQSTPSSYSTLTKRQYKGNQEYYWIVDDYLYIPGFITNATLLGLFIYPYEVDKLNINDKCLKMMDSECGVPDWLIDAVIDESTKMIAGVTKRIPEDSNPNLNVNN